MYNKNKSVLKRIGAIVTCMVMIISSMLVMTSCGASNEEPDLGAMLNETAELLLTQNPDPDFGSVGGEWLVLGMANWNGGVSEEWFEGYYKNVEAYVSSCKGDLSEHKNTEYSRVIIALDAMGKDPKNVGGYNLVKPLEDYDQTIFQGINGAVYALLALDGGDYASDATSKKYVDYILEQEVEGGGWSLAGGPADPDITAIVLQALAKYQSREDVSASIDRALGIMSSLQNESGGFENNGVESSETISQTILALTELGVSVDDSRFVKGGSTLLDKLLEFRTDDGGFKHVAEGESDLLATEQAFYALASLKNVQDGASSLYQ